MATITRFEDVQAWAKARTLVSEIYHLTGTGLFARDYALRDQLRRAGVSITSNIAEGFARRTSKVFINFLNIAHGSAAEVQSQLYVARDLRYISDQQFSRLYQSAEEVSKMTRGFMTYLKSNSQLPTRHSQLLEGR